MAKEDDDLITLQSELKKERQQKNYLMSELEAMRKTFDDMKEDKLRTEKSILEMKKKVDELFSEKKEIQSEYEVKLQGTDNNLRKYKEENETLVEKCTKIESKINTLRDEYKSKEKQYLEKNDALEKEIENIKQELTNNKIAHDNKLKTLDEELQQKIKVKDIEIQKKDEKIKQLDENFNNLTFQMRTSENIYREKIEESKKETKNQFENERIRLMEEMSEFRQKYENELKEKIDLQKEYTRRVKELEENTTLLEKKMKETKNLFFDKDYEAKQFKTKIEEVKETMELIKKKMKRIDDLLTL
jgi:epidermal growth factor receptor substrate 15